LNNFRKNELSLYLLFIATSPNPIFASSMTFGYHFSTDGQISKINLPKKIKNCNDLPASILGPAYEGDKSLYMASLSDDYFLMMHEDNDFETNYQKSKLPINQALQKYFPCSPYKGNIVLVRVDEDDLLKGGRWSDSVLRKYKMGYIEGMAINEPSVLSKKENKDYDLSKVPLPEKTIESPKPSTLKTCKQCGFPKTIFHYRGCMMNQTKVIVEKVAVIRQEHKDLDDYLVKESQPLVEEEGSWEHVTACKALLQEGLNQSGVRWCNFYLELFNKMENPIEKRTILCGLTSVLYCYDYNSRLDFSASSERCPQCEKDPEGCLKLRTEGLDNIRRWLDGFDFSQTSDFDENVDLPHLSINVFNQFFAALSAKKSEEDTENDEASLTISMMFSWAIILLEEYKIMKLVNEVDRELG